MRGRETAAQEHLLALSDVLAVMSRSPHELQPVLDAVIQHATRLCRAQQGFINMLEGDHYRWGVASWGISDEFRSYVEHNRVQPIGRGNATGRAILDRRVVNIPDALADPEFVSRDARRLGGFRALLGVPMLRDGVPLGVITLSRTDPVKFSEIEVQLVESFAQQAAIAIENVRLFNETREALERQTAISEILRVIAGSPTDVQPVLDAIADGAARFCGAENVDVILQHDDGLLHPSAHVGVLGSGVGPFLLSRETVTGRSMLQGHPVHVDDLQAEGDEYPLGSEQARAMGHRTTLATPLLRGGRAFGAILLRRADRRPFTGKQIDLVRTFADQAVIAIENVRLFNETKDALERQTAIAEILRVISESPTDLQPVLDAIAENAARFCGAEDAGVMLERENELRVVAHAGQIPLPDTLSYPIDRDTMTGRVFLDGVTLQVTDMLAAEVAAQYPRGHAMALEFGWRSAAITPLLREGRAIGTINLRRTEIRPFTDKQMELLRTFASQAVIAIENVRLFNETKEALERQTAVAEVLSGMSGSAFELQPLLETVIEHATKLCGAQNGFIYRKDGDVFRLSVAYGITAEFKAFTDANPVNPMGRGTVTGRVVQDGAVVHVPDVLADPEYTFWEAQRLGNFRAILGVPMSRGGVVIGVMLLWRTEPRPFTGQQIGLVTTFADQATIAIENVRLFTETKEALDQQTATSEVLQSISRSAFDLQAVLDTVVERAARLCGAEQAWMRRIEGDEFRFSAYYGASPELRAMFEELRLDGAMARIDHRGMGGRAVLERRAIHVHDIAADEQLREASLARRGGGRTGLAVPMLRDGAPIGAIVVARNRVAPFSDREIQLVETFADQAVIAIENVRLFNDIQEKSRQLEVAGRHKSEFLANMSHELRTPLNAIIGFSEVLLQGMFGELNAKQREYQDDVLSSGRHLLTLINDILDLSKIEAGHVQLELAEFSLPSALDNAVTMIRERASRHNIRVRVDVEGVDRIIADERKVKQIVANLLSNAVKFTPDGGHVDIRAAREDGEVRIAVRDTGIGIDDADRERIFEEFQQARRDPERSREGTGLGLALSRRYVELHGGRIWVESEVGRGSTFTFTLPLVPAGKEG